MPRFEVTAKIELEAENNDEAVSEIEAFLEEEQDVDWVVNVDPTAFQVEV